MQGVNAKNRKPIRVLLGWLVIGLVCVAGVQAEKENFDTMSAYEMAERAVVDTLYYNYDPWFERFQKRIRDLEEQPQTIPNQLELMKFYFYTAALYAELTHALSFTETYQIDSIRKQFQYHSQRTIDVARWLLDQPELGKQDRADAYFFLGVAEGYIALVEYGEGDVLSALIDGLRADNHLEDALNLDPKHADAHVGLGIYRYGNTRLGGLGNFLLQGGKDLRLVGLKHIEDALETKILSKPLAIKTLIWFYLSEQINPQNAGLAENETLSPQSSRKRAVALMEQYERLYFQNVHVDGFIGNKGLAMMHAIQSVLDGDYAGAKAYFQKALEISRYLMDKKGFRINPKYMETVEAGIEFCDLMLLESRKETTRKTESLCAGVLAQIRFIEDGGSMVDYQSSKIRREIQDVFYNRLKQKARENRCL